MKLAALKNAEGDTKLADADKEKGFNPEDTQ